MRLAYVYLPVDDLEAALALYRDTLGLEESWREGEETVALTIPGTDVGLMLDAEGSAAGKPGPFLEVESVDAFYGEHRDALRFVVLPKDIPPGRYTAFEDPFGNRVHVLDSTKGA